MIFFSVISTVCCPFDTPSSLHRRARVQSAILVGIPRKMWGNLTPLKMAMSCSGKEFVSQQGFQEWLDIIWNSRVEPFIGLLGFSKFITIVLFGWIPGVAEFWTFRNLPHVLIEHQKNVYLDKHCVPKSFYRRESITRDTETVGSENVGSELKPVDSRPGNSRPKSGKNTAGNSSITGVNFRPTTAKDEAEEVGDTEYFEDKHADYEREKTGVRKLNKKFHSVTTKLDTKIWQKPYQSLTWYSAFKNVVPTASIWSFLRFLE